MELICSTGGEEINGILNLPTLKQAMEIYEELGMENGAICEGWTGFMISPDKNIQVYQILGVGNGLYILMRPDRASAKITRNFTTGLEKVVEGITGKRIRIRRSSKTVNLIEAPWKMLYSQYVPHEILKDQSLKYIVSKILDPFAKDVTGSKKIILTSGEEATAHMISRESLKLSEPFDGQVFTLNWAYYSCQAALDVRKPDFKECAVKILNREGIPVRDFALRFGDRGGQMILISGGLKLLRPFLGKEVVEIVDDYGNIEWFMIDILKSGYPIDKIESISKLKFPLDRVILSLISGFKLDVGKMEKFVKVLIKNRNANLVTEDMLIRLESTRSRRSFGKLYLIKVDGDAMKVYGFSTAITAANFPTITYNILEENVWPNKRGFQGDDVSKAFNLSAFRDGPAKIYQALNRFFEDRDLALFAIKFVKSRLFESKEEEVASQVLSYFAGQRSRNMLEV